MKYVKFIMVISIVSLTIITCVSQIVVKDIIRIDSLRNSSIYEVFWKTTVLSKKYIGSDTSFFECQGDKIMVLSEFIDGIKMKATGFFDNKNKFKETYFNETGKNGPSIEWYKNGKKKEQSTFLNDNYISPTIRWYDDGSLKEFIDEDNGIHKGWYNSGKIEVIQRYSSNDDGRKVITWDWYYENGHLHGHTIDNNGKQPIIYYYENGQKSLDGYIFNNPFFQIGKHCEWHENGVMSRDYYFHDSIPNQREGTWKWFDENGNLTKEEYYKNGEKTGEKEFLPVVKKKN